MKKTTTLFMLSVLAAGFTACSLGVPEEVSDAVSLKVRTGSATKVSETDGIYWVKDEIGVNVVSVTDGTGSTDSESKMTDYKNMRYTTDLDGKTDVTSADFTAADGKEIWFDTDSEVNVTAYAPFTGTAGTLPGDEEDGIITVSTDATAQGSYSDIDYIFASEVTTTRQSPVANLVFSHVMAQIVLDVVPEDGSTLDVSGYSLGGLVLSGTFNTTTGEVEADNVSRSNQSGFTLSALGHTTNDDGSFTYIVLVCPQTTVLSFSTDGGTTSKSNAYETYFHGGRSYHFTATVASDGTFTISGGEIYEWQDYMDSEYEFGASSTSLTGICVDDDLTITFRNTPKLGTSGSIRIYSYDPDDDDTDPVLVDQIDMEDNIDPANRSSQMTSSTKVDTGMQILTGDPYNDADSRHYKVFYYTPVEVSGNVVTIHPHIGALDFDTNYYVTIDEGAVSASGFEKLDAKEWTFKTCSAPEFSVTPNEDSENEATAARVTVSVGKTGSDVQFRTIQRALEYMCATYRYNPVTIEIADGVYTESIFARGKNYVTFHGASRDGTIVRAYSCGDLYSGDNPNITTEEKPAVGGTVGGNPGNCIVYFDGGLTGVRFENMSLVNTASASSSNSVVLYYNCNNTNTIACVNCLFSGGRRALYVKGCSWFYDCLVEGTENYLYSGSTALASMFENSEIRTVSGGSGAVCQSTSTSLGFVFLNCAITTDGSVTDNSVYLATATGSGDSVAYISCSAGSDVLNSNGWNTSSASVTPTSTAGFRYYNFKIGDESASWSDSYVHEITSEEYSGSVYESGDEDNPARKKIFTDESVAAGSDWLNFPSDYTP